MREGVGRSLIPSFARCYLGKGRKSTMKKNLWHIKDLWRRKSKGSEKDLWQRKSEGFRKNLRQRKSEGFEKDLWQEKMKELGEKIRPAGPMLPAVCLGILVAAVLTQYDPPEPAAYEVEASGFSFNLNPAAQAQSTESTEAEGKKGAFELEDGVYQGSGTGYGGTITVDVTISEKTMTAIDVVSAARETESFFERAKGVITSMLSQQTTEVDVVSGATYSSNGIIAAVENALYGTESTASTAAAAGQTGSAPDVGEVDDTDVTYKDGTYTGSAQGFGGQIKVEVTIKNGKISKINVLDASGETASYFARAKTLLNTIIKKQTTNVDVVSGATYSSNGLIKAVRNALSKAEKTTSKKKSKKKNTSKSDSTSDSSSGNSGNNSGVNVSEGAYEDGTYTGTAAVVDSETGNFDYTLELSITIKDGKITNVAYTDSFKNSDSYGMNSQWLENARGMFSKVINANSTNVDVVSGATYSSNGIKEAVNNALEKAKQSSANTQTEAKPETTTAKKEETTTAGSGGSSEETTESGEGSIYNNGTYSVSVQCYPDNGGDFSEYTMEMDVVISNDRITAVKNVRGTTGNKATNSWYINKAASEVGGKIAASGSPDGIDAYSGATCSSNAIIEGCKKALEAAKK